MDRQQRPFKDVSIEQSQKTAKPMIQQYSELKSRNKIPQQMQTKLNFLLRQIQGQSNNSKQSKSKLTEPYQQQDLAYEKQQINQLGALERVQMFNKIIKFLSGQQKIVYFNSQKVYFFKEKMFSKWATNVYLNFDSDFLVAYQSNRKGLVPKNNTFLFKIPTSLLKVSKKVNMFDKKIVFWVMNLQDKTKHIIGFKNHVTCHRLHSLLLSSANEKGTQKLQQLLDFPEHNKTKKTNQQSQPQQQVQPPMNQLSQFWEKAQKLFEQPQYQLSTNHLYSNLKNLKGGSGRLLIHNSNKNRLKFISLIQADNEKDSILVPSFALDHYIRSMSQWNSEVQILKQIQQESDSNNETKRYYIKFKRYSMMSYQRQAIFDVEKFQTVKSNGFIVSYMLFYPFIEQKSIIGKLTSTLRAQVRQLVQIKRKITQNVVFFTVLSEIDFKGHNSDEDKKNMNCKIINQLQNFQQFMKIQKCEQLKQQPIPSIVIERESAVRHNQKSIVQFTQVKANKQENFKEFVRILQKNNINQPTGQTQSFLQFLRQKVHEKYYLKNRFNQNFTYQPNRMQHCAQIQGNFLTQAIKGDKKRPAWKINQQNVLQSVDYEYIEANKGVGAFIIKQVGSNLLSGKSIINISLPVQIFDYCSNLEKIAYVMGFTAKYISEASLLKDPLQQMKKIVLMVMSFPSISFSVRKPFNPILGQTFQCKIAGIPFFLQQISHHPPITAYLMKTQEFQFYGQSQAGMNLGFNAIFGKQHRMGNVKFKNTKTHFKFLRAPNQFNGVMYGPKTLKFVGKDMVHQITNNLHAQCSFGGDSKKVYESQTKMKPNDVIGGIFKSSPKYTEKYFSQKVNKEEAPKLQPIKPSDIVQKIVKISGNWTETIYFDAKQVKKLMDPAPNRIQYQDYVLPSDSNFRQDLIYRKMNDFKKSQQVKQIMQNVQRRDRKLRQKYMKKNR